VRALERVKTDVTRATMRTTSNRIAAARKSLTCLLFTTGTYHRLLKYCIRDLRLDRIRNFAEEASEIAERLIRFRFKVKIGV